MGNRRELLDEALLRPGRLEVQIEVPLPSKEGRREILQILFGTLRQQHRLSRPLCCAIDGTSTSNKNNNRNQQTFMFPKKDNKGTTNQKRKRDALQRVFSTIFQPLSVGYYDLAAATHGFSGADIAGLVRAVSF